MKHDDEKKTENSNEVRFIAPKEQELYGLPSSIKTIDDLSEEEVAQVREYIRAIKNKSKGKKTE